jgi:uncharacterized protein YpuA (DUF1002 family)
MRRFNWVILCLFLLTSFVAAEGPKIVGYGNDLSPGEKATVSRDLNLPVDLKAPQIKSIIISNEDEWSLLKGLVPDQEIGTRAVSTVYIEKLTSGEGIKVETKNITLITPRMYANALATAGIMDAKFLVIAPAPVSGTAALAGIYKAYRELANNILSPRAKQTAAQELVTTGDLGEKIGKERAALLVERAKEQVIQSEAKTQEEMLKIVDRSAKEENLSLAKEEKDELAALLLKIKDLNLNLNTIQTQLKNFSPLPPKENIPPSQPQSLVAKIIEFFRSLFSKLFSSVGRLFSR